MIGPTLAELRADVQARGWSLDLTTFNTVINGALRRLYGEYRWPFLQVDAALTITDLGQLRYDFSDDLPNLTHVEALRLEWNDGGDTVELQYLPLQDIRRLAHGDRSPGCPWAWSYVDTELYLYPRPDRVYTLLLDGLAYTELVADTDRASVPRAYKDILVMAAAAELSSRQRDWQGVGAAEAAYQGRLTALKQQYGMAQRQQSSSVVHSDFWDNAAT